MSDLYRKQVEDFLQEEIGCRNFIGRSRVSFVDKISAMLRQARKEGEMQADPTLLLSLPDMSSTGMDWWFYRKGENGKPHYLPDNEKTRGHCRAMSGRAGYYVLFYKHGQGWQKLREVAGLQCGKG